MPLWYSKVQRYIELDWSFTSSGGAVGTNIYRGTVSGGPYTILVSNVSGTTYNDFQINPGQTYYYVFTEIDGLGGESAQSSEISAVVQSP
jgi:fibronectin type 3 domain-containing protein